MFSRECFARNMALLTTSTLSSILIKAIWKHGATELSLKTEWWRMKPPRLPILMPLKLNLILKLEKMFLKESSFRILEGELFFLRSEEHTSELQSLRHLV